MKNLAAFMNRAWSGMMPWLTGVMLFFVCTAAVLADDNATPVAERNATLEDLGQGRYRIGTIIADKLNKTLRVPGKVLRVEPPLEFLAVTKGGMKGYESLLELDVNAFEFNLACILIGLNEARGVAPEFHFSEKPAQGDPVMLSISWERGGKLQRIMAGQALLQDGKTVKDDWVYTASMFTADGEYLANTDGTLVGFVHDPASIIEHRQGLGLGRYGAVGGNTAALPAVGNHITLIVESRLQE